MTRLVILNRYAKIDLPTILNLNDKLSYQDNLIKNRLNSSFNFLASFSHRSTSKSSLKKPSAAQGLKLVPQI